MKDGETDCRTIRWTCAVVLTGLLPAVAGELSVGGGEWRVNGGTVKADRVTVVAGATLSGNGTVAADTEISGVVSPGTSGAENTGTLTFMGQLTFLARSTFHCYAASHTQMDRLVASGAVSGMCTVVLHRAAGAVPLDEVVIDGAGNSDYGYFAPAGDPAELKLTSGGVGDLLLTDMVGDSDGDGIPDAWENENFGNRTAGVPSVDSDKDGLNNEEEFVAGTDPNDTNSVLVITAIRRVDDTRVAVSWQSVNGRVYDVLRGMTLSNTPATSVGMGITGIAPLNTLTDTVSNVDGHYYRVKVKR